MTGREFCEPLEIDCNEIVEMQKSDQNDNMNYFMEKLTKIKETKQYFTK